MSGQEPGYRRARGGTDRPGPVTRERAIRRTRLPDRMDVGINPVHPRLPCSIYLVFQAHSHFLKVFRHARLHFLDSRLRGNNGVMTNDVVAGITLLGE